MHTQHCFCKRGFLSCNPCQNIRGFLFGRNDFVQLTKQMFCFSIPPDNRFLFLWFAFNLNRGLGSWAFRTGTRNPPQNQTSLATITERQLTFTSFGALLFIANRAESHTLERVVEGSTGGGCRASGHGRPILTPQFVYLVRTLALSARPRAKHPLSPENRT